LKVDQISIEEGYRWWNKIYGELLGKKKKEQGGLQMAGRIAPKEDKQNL